MTMKSIEKILDPTHLLKISDDELAREAIDLAGLLLEEAKRQETPSEKTQAAKIARMMNDTNGKIMTQAMCDQVFRSHRSSRIADQLNHLVDLYGVPKYLGNWEQWALWLGSTIGEYIPSVVVPFVVAKLRQDTNRVILPGEEQEFREYIHRRRDDGIRLNLNQLGEAILGEEEAARRLEGYLNLLARDDVEYISVKISSVFSQINLIAFDATVDEIKKRLRILYRQAMKFRFVSADGRRLPKFVNLDMEEYRDLALTVAAFKQVLDEDEFKTFRAGIVLQAYLPDAHPAQRDLTEWAMERVANGGASIKIRIVKGANLAMERVEAEWHGWEQAPYRTKPEVDANYKRMVVFGMQPEHARAVNLGVASHNLFDIAFAMLLRAKYLGAEQQSTNDDPVSWVEFEMLEGMANNQARAVKDAANGLLLYAPVVKREDFHSAIAYLVRRLDENTAPENFLHDVFDLEVGGATWEKQRRMFLDSVKQRDTVLAGAQRRQNRATEQRTFDPNAPFENEPDTDWSLKHNANWIAEIANKWRAMIHPPIPLQIGGEFLPGNTNGSGSDPSRPNFESYRYALASKKEIDAALNVAVEAQKTWGRINVENRKRVLIKCAEVLAQRRGELIGAMMREGGKAVPEADVEVSEAIDFANYYARTFDLSEDLTDVSHNPLGTILVTPPWNFPLAIPCGGILAALMAGNTVILKSAPEAVLTAWHLCNALWDAGVPKEALQFLPTTDDDTGKSLVTDDRVNAVILTGAYSTGQMFKSWKPHMKLFAETSGKNSLIITAMADHDQAIKDLVKSAFGHAGQKCSAASLAVLEAEVYDNTNFMRQLRDAAASLKVGSAWELTSSVTPIVREPSDALRRGLTQLDMGESWLLEPKMIDGNPCLWSPGIKLGVKRGSWYHRNECFGPVLGLMRADDLDDAIDIVNDSELGLTSGLHSLDNREQDKWGEKIEVGNAYINRGTTGAIVQRQPFGGWKKSVFGNAKAGGPNYVFSLCKWSQRVAPKLLSEWSTEVQELLSQFIEWCASNDKLSWIEKLQTAAGSFAHAWQTHFSQAYDPSQVLGESNVFRYRPIRNVMIRVGEQDKTVGISDTSMVWSDTVWLSAMLSALAAKTCGVEFQMSVASAQESDSSKRVRHLNVEDEKSFIQRIKNFERIRATAPLTREANMAANDAHVLIVDSEVLLNGRLELRHYLREQAISMTTHRYGNLIR
jgi:RHH-type proline utilization regulon transcriptional repressor/proline dehydrogenase/delta 1-pyrroline-5-carboxylate dehydrogenase